MVQLEGREGFQKETQIPYEQCLTAFFRLLNRYNLEFPDTFAGVQIFYVHTAARTQQGIAALVESDMKKIPLIDLREINIRFLRISKALRNANDKSGIRRIRQVSPLVVLQQIAEKSRGQILKIFTNKIERKHRVLMGFGDLDPEVFSRQLDQEYPLGINRLYNSRKSKV